MCHKRGENSTKENLKECNVLTVNQTIAFRVLLKGLKTLRTGRLRGLNDMIRRGERGRGGMETRSEGNEVQRVCKSFFCVPYMEEQLPLAAQETVRETKDPGYGTEEGIEETR